MRRLLAVLALFAWGQAVAQDAASPTLERIARNGAVYLAYDESSVPFSYTLPGQDRPQGYGWDICLRIVSHLETRLGRKLAVVPVVSGANSRLLAIKAGMADIACGLSGHTVARQKLATFSNTLYVAETRLLARADVAAAGLAGLNGRRVATVSGSPGERLLKLAMLQRGLVVEHLSLRSQDEAVRLLESGAADVLVGEDTALARIRAGSKQASALVVLPDSLSIEPYALALPLQDRAFKQLVDALLVSLMQSGELAQLYDKWFVQPIPLGSPVVNTALGLPLSEMNKASFAYPNDRPAN